MPKKLGHFCWHISAFSLKIIGLVSVVTVMSITAFIWRVSSEPLDISFAKDYIQSVMHDEATGNSARMERVVLFWPELKGPLYLQLHGGQLVNNEGAVIVSVDMAAISFSRIGLLTGRVLPKSIILKKPTLRLIRTISGEIKLDLGQNDPEENSQEQFALTTRIFSYIARPGRESTKRSLISRLVAFSIEDARLFIDDQIANQSWSLPDFNFGFHSTKTGMEGYADLRLPDIGLDTSELHIDMKYLWDQKNVELSADLKNIDVKAIAGKVPELGVLGSQNIVLNAHLETILDENFIPEDVRAEVTSERGDILHPDMSDEPIPYTDLSLSASYNYAGKALLLKDTSITVKDVTVFAEAEVIHNDNKVNGPVRVWIEDLKHAQIGPLWPKILRGDNSEKWIVQRMSKGTFHNVWLGFDLIAEKKFPEEKLQKDGGQEENVQENADHEESLKPIWDVDVQNLGAEFAFKNMRVDYRPPLDAATKINGTGRFDLNKDELSLDISKGQLGAMSVSGAHLLFDRVVAVGQGGADLTINLSGGVQDVMRYISKEPINLGDDINMDIEKVRGQAELEIGLKFPTQADVQLKDFKIRVDGTLNKVLLPDVIHTLDLSGGPLAFSVKDGLASMKGEALLEKRPMKFSWEEFLNSEGKPYKEKVTAKITADPNIRELLGIDLSDFIEGSLPVDVSYVSYRDGSAKADVSVDATSALFFVDPFDFEKKPGEKASAKFISHFKDDKIQKITDLTAEGENFKLSKSGILFKHIGEKTNLSSGSLGYFILEETKAKLDFVFDEADVVNIVLDASFLDVQPFMDAEDSKGEYREPAMLVSVSARQMRTAPEETLKNAKLFFDIDGQGRFNQMEMNAKVGQGDLYVRYKLDKEGKRTFRLKADDAGAFLKAFQVYKDIRGGTLVIYGEPIRGILDRNLRGKAEISNFKVVNAPSLTKILSILSLTGIGEVMAGEGLSFDKLESDFSWLYRKGGSLLVLKDGRTSGNSLGLLFDGTFDNKKRVVDVSGTVVPMSALNEIIGSIPLIGDILTGGSGGVFAATYSIKGTSENPEISVNPLSVLTPGIIRRVLFE